MAIIDINKLRKQANKKKHSKKPKTTQVVHVLLPGDYIVSNYGKNGFTTTVHGSSDNLIGIYQDKALACEAADKHAKSIGKNDINIFYLSTAITYTYIRKTK